MGHKERWPWWEYGLLALILLLAGGLRMGWPGLTEFKADEARLTYLALQMVDGAAFAEGGQFPIRGISSSVGVPNFPMSVWLYGIPLLFWTHVYAATIFTGLLNTLAVLGCYWFVRRYWGWEAAIVATLMFAVSPWAIHHSRKIWAQNLLPFFVMGWGISGALAFVEGRKRWIVAHLFCLAVAVQAHLAGVALVPATAVFIILFWRQVSWRWLGLGVLLGGGTAVPFGYYLLVRVGGVALPASEGLARGWDTLAWRYTWLLTSGREIHALVGAEALPQFLVTVPDLSIVHWLWTLLALAGVGLMALTVVNGKREFPYQRVEWMLLVWGVMPLLLFSLPVLPVELHYLLPVYPVPYIAAGIAWKVGLAYASQRWQLVLVWGSFVGMAALQVLVWGRLLAFITTQATPGAFGVPVARQLQAVDLVRQQLAESGASEVLLAGEGDDPEDESFPAIYRTLLYDVPHRFVAVEETAVLPAQAAVVLLADDGDEGSALYREVATDVEEVALRRGEGNLVVLGVRGAKTAVWEPDVLFEPSHILTNWASWRGYDVPVYHSDGTATWRVHWYAGAVTVTDFHLFTHLLQVDGARVGQVDGATFPARQWREGDVVVSYFRLAWPQDVVTARMGMYAYPSLEPVLVFDVAGNPYTDGIEIPIE